MYYLSIIALFYFLLESFICFLSIVSGNNSSRATSPLYPNLKSIPPFLHGYVQSMEFKQLHLNVILSNLLFSPHGQYYLIKIVIKEQKNILFSVAILLFKCYYWYSKGIHNGFFPWSRWQDKTFSPIWVNLQNQAFFNFELTGHCFYQDKFALFLMLLL